MASFSPIFTAGGFTLVCFVAFLLADELIAGFIRQDAQNQVRSFLLVIAGPVSMVIDPAETHGLAIDMHLAALSLATAFGGLPAGLVAGALQIAVRLAQDGPILQLSVLGIVLTLALSAGFVRWRMPGAPAVLPPIPAILQLGCIPAAVVVFVRMGLKLPAGLPEAHHNGPALAIAQLLFTWLLGGLLVLQAERRLGQGARARLSLSQAVRGHGLARASREFMFKLAPDGRILAADEAYAEASGYSLESLRGMRVGDLSGDQQPGTVMDVMRRIRAAGVLTFETSHRNAAGQSWPLEITAIWDPRANCAYGFARDITDRQRADQLLVEKNVAMHQALRRILYALFTAMTQHDSGTSGHEERVQDLALAIGHRLGFSADQLEGLGFAALVHDIGQLRVPQELINRPRKLRPEEFELVKQHPEAGHDILKDIAFPWPVAEIVWQHHENFDGSGYPRGLRGDQMLPEARILQVASAAEAMLSHRPWRRAMPRERVMAELAEQSGHMFDPPVAQICLDLLREGYSFPVASHATASAA